MANRTPTGATRSRRRSNLMTRIASALVMAAAVLVLVIYARPLYFAAALGIVGTVCMHEYFRLVRAMGLKGQPWFGYLAFWALLGALYQKEVLGAAVAAVLIAGFLTAIWRREPLRDRALGLMANSLGASYMAFLLYPAVPVRFQFGDGPGLHWTILLFAVIWTGDSAALFVGKSLGRTPFAPHISPKKTWEGAAGGLLGGVAAAVVLQRLVYHDLPLPHVAAVALLTGAFGQLGDLAESMLKRAAEVKDSSDLIPGHGGVLDRIDSLLFAYPVLYLYLLWLYSGSPR
jgi:phosphatidate cytidylyltransferase